MKGKGLIIFFLLVLIAGLEKSTLAQEHKIPLSKPENLEIMENIRSRTNDLVGKNMNRFAYEKLVRYNHTLDSLYRIEKGDSLKRIEAIYLAKTAALRSQLDSLNRQINENSGRKAELDTRYWGLVKKAVLSFALWLIIIIILLQIRKRKLKQAKSRFETTKIQLESLEKSASYSDVLVEHFKNIREPISGLSKEVSKVNDIISDKDKNPVVSPEWAETVKKSEQLKKSVQLEENIVEDVIAQIEGPGEEKVSTNINDLCEQYVEIARRGFCTDVEFNCQITKDFEKRLPELKINPAAIGSLLLNILTNALQSVNDQNSKGQKGYQPKVAISTRILPRFLQIRIRDNGTGMNEQILSQATNEFFSTRPLSDGTGLGLFFANGIINEMHKGEIKIESEQGASTDVYIKFFI